MTPTSSQPGAAAAAELDSLLRAVAVDPTLVERLLRMPLSQLLEQLDEEGFSGSLVWEAIQADPNIEFDHYRALLTQIPEEEIMALSPREIQAEHPGLAQELLETIGQHLLAVADDDGLLQTAGGTKFGPWGGSGTSMWRTDNSRTKKEKMEARGTDSAIGVSAAITVGVVGYQRGWWGNKGGRAKQSEPLGQQLEKKSVELTHLPRTNTRPEKPMIKQGAKTVAPTVDPFEVKSGLINVDCGGGGDCLYHSLAQGLKDLKEFDPSIKTYTHRQLREIGLDYMMKNQSGFEPKSFALAPGESRFETMQSYIAAHSATGHWGDQQNVQALSKALGVNIGVKPKVGEIQYSFANITDSPTIYVQHNNGHYTLLRQDPDHPERFDRFREEDILRECRNNPFPGADNPNDMQDVINQGGTLEDAYNFFAPSSKEAYLQEAEAKALIVKNWGLGNLDIRRIRHIGSRRLSEAFDASGASHVDTGLDQSLSEVSRDERHASRIGSSAIAEADSVARSDLEQGSTDLVDSLDRDGGDLIDKEMNGLEDI